MKKYSFLIYIIIAIIIIALIVFFINKNNNKNTEDNTSNIQSNTSTQRTSTNVNQEMAENRIANIIENQNEILGNIANNNSSTTTNNEISSYSTELKDKSDGRLVNIGITCSTLNGTIVHPGETFSFNQVVGKPTAEKGYQEASVIIDHKTEKGIGGGNCQVSSTLYNAVLEAGNLTIIERHEHGKDVTYVPDGRDAAVSYGSLDFKFRNDLNYDIRIEASTDSNSISIVLLKA